MEEKAGRSVADLHYRFASSEFSEPMASDGSGVYRPGADGTFEKPVQVLKYPLAKGTTWDSKLPMGGMGPDSKAVVKGPVEITVPAGKFRAVEVEFVGETNGQKMTLTAWYTEGVGVVKQVSDYGTGTDTTIELKEFTPAK